MPIVAEQHRIVTKLEDLRALRDRLESALSTSDAVKQRLLESLLHEALTEGAHNKDIA